MFREIWQVLTGDDALSEARKDFETMIGTCLGMVTDAGEMFRSGAPNGAGLEELRQRDVTVNQLEREVRRKLAAHATGKDASNVSHALLMMSLVKDAERIGDYAKNLAELASIGGVVPGGVEEELAQIAGQIEELGRESLDILVAAEPDRAKARDLALHGKELGRACQDIVNSVAKSDLAAGDAIRVALGARFYKRIASHLKNLLTSVVMPLHKVDYLDEKLLEAV